MPDPKPSDREQRDRRLRRRWTIELFVFGTILLAGAAALFAADGDRTLTVLGLVGIGIGGVLGSGVAFYEVGRTEDRARDEGRH